MISVDDLLFFLDEALDGMVGVITELGDGYASQRPDIPGANSPYAILTHCLGVMEYWGENPSLQHPITPTPHSPHSLLAQ